MNNISNKIFNQLGEKDSVALITWETNRMYVTGYYLSEGFVAITSSESYVIVDSRYYEEAKRNIKDFDVIESKSIIDGLKKISEKKEFKHIFIENNDVTVKTSNILKKYFEELDIDIVSNDSLSSIISQFRSIKSSVEIEKIKRSQELTDSAFLYALSQIKPGVSEKKLAMDIEFFLRSNGAEKVAFDLIVVSGENTSLPHGKPSDRKISNGDFLTIDMGAVLDGYHSDMTRTVAIGKISDQQRYIYDIVLKAQKTAISSVKPNIKASQVDLAARKVIESLGFGNYFGHSTGHGVGLDIHEEPTVSQKSNTILKPGMVITIEPGIYLDGQINEANPFGSRFGVRIEDMVIINDHGFENITNSEKNLITL